MKKINSIIDWFIRPEYSGNKFVLQKTRLLVANHFITIIYALIHLIIFAFIDYDVAVYALAMLIIGGIAGLFLFKKFISGVCATNTIIFWAYLGFLAIIYTTGGIYSPTVSWLLPVSLIGFLLANRLSGFIWSAISIITILSLFILDKNGFQFQITLRPEYISLHNAIAFSGSSLFILLIVAIYDAIIRQRTHELEAINEKLVENDEFLTHSFEVLRQKESDLQAVNRELLVKTKELMQQREEIYTQKEEIESQRDEIYQQKEEIEKKNQNLTDSIQYASRIQDAMLPSHEIIAANLSDHFILFKPRDIVSGDFYWCKQIKNFTYIAAADCTGHGVPGAFMSMLGISLLNEIVTKRDLNPPNEVLDELRKRIKKSLHQNGQDGETQDGMDIALCLIDKETNILQYAGAFNPLYLVRKNEEYSKCELIETKANRMPIGVHPFDGNGFENNIIHLKANDRLYIFSDGFTSQFGEKENEKYKTKRLKDLLLDIQEKSMEEQKLILNRTHIEWQGNFEQVDDILVIGVQI